MLTTVFVAVAAIVAITMALVCSFSAVRVATSAWAGMLLVLVVFCIETWLVALPAIRLGLNIYPQDLVFLGLAVLGGGRLTIAPQPSVGTIAWLTFGSVLAVSFALGVGEYGTAAGVDLRPIFYFWATTIYFSSFRIQPREADRLVRLMLVAGVVVLLIVLYRWTADALHIGGVTFSQIGAGKPLRVLTASQTYFLATLAIVLTWSAASQRGRGSAAWLALMFILTVILLQHRSVWVATVFGLLVLYVGVPNLRPQFRRFATIGGVVGLVALIPLFATGTLDPLISTLVESIEEALQPRGSTFSWRQQSTRELLLQWLNGGPLVNLIGKPFGSGYERFLEDLGHVTNYSPHNFYVQMLLRVGLIGTVSMAAAYLYSIRHFWLSRHNEPDTRLIGFAPLAALLVANLVFFYPYGAHFIHGLFLGLALSLSSRRNDGITIDRQIARPIESNAR